MRFFRVLRAKMLRDRRGIGLIQILVGAFVASIISLGIAQMMQQARISQRRIGLMTTVSELQKRINYMILDQGSFGISVNRNVGAPFTALQSGTAQAGGGPVKMVLYDASGDLTNMLDLLGPADTTGNGFTEKGTPCSTFNANSGAGNDDCPISYRIMVQWTCPRGGTCLDPQLVVAARLVFNPSTAPNRILQRFSRLLQQGPADTTSPAMKFDAVVKRTASSVAREFKITAFRTAGSALGAECGNGGNFKGGGLCTLALAVHPIFLLANWTEEYDAHDLVTTVVGGNFSFNEPGYYSCSIKAYAYRTDTADIVLYNTTTAAVVGSATTYAGSGAGTGSSGGAESLLRLDVAVNVPLPPTTNPVFQIQQRCGSVAGGVCSMGFAKDNTLEYAPLSLSCTKLDQSF